jgi:molybdate transport system ATP-binding protein
MTTPDWLHFDSVSVRLRGHLFLRDFCWHAANGEQWAVLGRNGAGKTVLMQLLAGSLRASSGSIGLGKGLDVQHDIAWVSFEQQQQLCLADTRHDISEFMETAVDTGTTVRALLAGVAREPGRIEAVATALGIETLLERGIRFLSSGEMRRTLIARALLQQARVIVLDNPYEGIDAASRGIVRRIIDELLASACHVLLLTRRPQDIPDGISHVLVLEQGVSIAAGPRQSALAAPRVQQLFAHDDAGAGLAALPRGESHAPHREGAVLELNDVHVHYGELSVLLHLDMRLDPGEHLCIAGPNGCGKSTLLGLICGDNPRAYGQDIRLFGRRRGSGESVWEVKRRFGVVSNTLHLEYPPRSCAFDVVASGLFDTLGLYEQCGPLQNRLVRAWLDALGLSAHGGTRFDALSFGEQRLLLIARAMVKSPQILILDEPCSGLDDHNRRRVLALVERIAAETDTQILFVSHEADEMPRCITRRLEFRRGADGRYQLS